MFLRQSLLLEGGFLLSRHPSTKNLPQFLSLLVDVSPSVVVVLDSEQSTVCTLAYRYLSLLTLFKDGLISLLYMFRSLWYFRFILLKFLQWQIFTVYLFCRKVLIHSALINHNLFFLITLDWRMGSGKRQSGCWRICRKTDQEQSAQC